MKRQLVVTGLAALLVSVLLSGCNQVDRTLNPEERKFVGTWVTDDQIAWEDLGDTLVFFSDGTVTFQSDVRGTFEVDAGNYLIVHMPLDGIQTQHLFDYEFTENNTILRLQYQATGRLYRYTRE